MLRQRLAGLTLESAIEWLAVIGAFATIPLTVIEWDHESGVTDAIDILIWIAFVIETAFLYRRARRGEGGWIWVLTSALVCILSCPLWLIVFRQYAELAGLVRLLRVLRLVRLGGVGFIGFPALRRVVRPGLVYIAGLTTLLIVIAAGIFALAEPKPLGGNYLNSLWLATATAATVGYGDEAPKTLIGRTTAVALMIAGIGLLSTLSASIAAAFIGQEDAAEERETRRRIERMERLLRGADTDRDLHQRMERMEALLEALVSQSGVDHATLSAPEGPVVSTAERQENGSTS